MAFNRIEGTFLLLTVAALLSCFAILIYATMKDIEVKKGNKIGLAWACTYDAAGIFFFLFASHWLFF